MAATLTGEISNLLTEINRLLHGKHHDLALQHGLSSEQFHLLVELDELSLAFSEDGMAPTVGEIAQSLNRAQNTVSEKISRLERRGLVERVPDAEDRRITRIVLTERCRKLLAAIDFLAGEEFLQRCLARLTDEALEQLAIGLRALRSSIVEGE